MDAESRLKQEKSELLSHFDKKMGILNALESMIGPDLPFRKVKVSMLCEKANISRTQFYAYFDNINDIPKWHSLIAHEMGLDRIGISLNWWEGYLYTSKEYIAHRTLYNSVAKDSGIESPYASTLRHRKDQLTCNIIKNGIEITPLLAFQVDAYPILEFAVFTKWNRGQIDLPLREFCTYISTLVPRELFEALNNPA